MVGLAVQLLWQYLQTQRSDEANPTTGTTRNTEIDGIRPGRNTSSQKEAKKDKKGRVLMRYPTQLALCVCKPPLLGMCTPHRKNESTFTVVRSLFVFSGVASSVG